MRIVRTIQTFLTKASHSSMRDALFFTAVLVIALVLVRPYIPESWKSRRRVEANKGFFSEFSAAVLKDTPAAADSVAAVSDTLFYKSE